MADDPITAGVLKGGGKFYEEGKGIQEISERLGEQNKADKKAHHTAELQAHLNLQESKVLKTELVQRGIDAGIWASQQQQQDDIIAGEIRVGSLDQRVADEVYRQKKEKEDTKLQQAFDRQVKLQSGEGGFRGMIKGMGEGFGAMIESNKTISDRLSDIGSAFSDDLSFMGDMMSPLSSLPGVNTAMTILKSTGSAALTLATKEGRERAKEAIARLKFWGKDSKLQKWFQKSKLKERMEAAKEWAIQKMANTKAAALAMKTFIMNKAKIAWDKMIAMKQALGQRAKALKGGVGKMIAKLPPKARMLAMLIQAIAGLFIGIFVMIAAFGKEIIKPIQAFFKIIGTKVKGLFKGFKLPARLVKAIKAVKTFFGPKGAIGKAFKFISNIFAKIGSAVSKFSKGSAIVRTMGSFGKILGKLFWPITMLMGAWEAMKGFISGFKSTEGGFGEKVIGGIYGALQALVDFLIMWPLDLIKDLIAWVGDKLGFDTTKLKEFSFSDMWKMISDKFIDGVMSVVRFVKAIAVGIGAGIAALWPGGEGPMEAFKRAFDETMAKPSGKKAATIEKPEKGTGEKMQEEKVRLDAQKASGRRRLSKGMQEEIAAREAARKGGGNVIGINVKNEGAKIHLDGTTPDEASADNNLNQ